MAAYTVDTRGLRLAGGAMLAAGAVLPMLPGDPGLPCPLRALTGIPCPMCGMTTSVTSSMQLHLGDALAANPGGVALVVLAIVLLIVRPSKPLSVPVWLLGALTGFLWLWELNRFAII